MSNPSDLLLTFDLVTESTPLEKAEEEMKRYVSEEKEPKKYTGKKRGRKKKANRRSCQKKKNTGSKYNPLFF